MSFFRLNLKKIKYKKETIISGYFYFVLASTQKSNLLFSDLKAKSKLKDVLDDFYFFN